MKACFILHDLMRIFNPFQRPDRYILEEALASITDPTLYMHTYTHLNQLSSSVVTENMRYTSYSVVRFTTITGWLAVSYRQDKTHMRFFGSMELAVA